MHVPKKTAVGEIKIVNSPRQLLPIVTQFEQLSSEELIFSVFCMSFIPPLPLFNT